MRGRHRTEIRSPENLLVLLETHETYPDLGDWWITRRLHGGDPDKQPAGPFHSHNGICNWLFADQHAKHIKLAFTCTSEFWTDGLPSRTGGCTKLDQIADEYK